MPQTDISFVHGIPEEMRSQAATLYDTAFGEKFAVAIRKSVSRIALFADSFHLQCSFAAIANGRLVGMAGYRTDTDSLTNGLDYSRLIANLGRIHGNWAAAILSMYERKLTPNELMMDGIAVDPEMRGNGIGTRLLSDVADFATRERYDTIRLDVIDTNPDARRLYERNGFVPTKTERFGYLRWLLGFGASTTLVRTVKNEA